MDLETLSALQESAAANVARLDWVFLAYIAYGVIRGVFRGLSEELAGLLGTLLVFVGAWKYNRPVAAAILRNTRMEDEAMARGLSYLLMAIAFLIAWKVAILLLRKTLDRIFPDHLKRPGGALLGGAKSALALCVVLTAAQLSGIPWLREHVVEGTRFGRFSQEKIPGALARWWPALYPDDPERPGAAVDAHGP